MTDSRDPEAIIAIVWHDNRKTAHAVQLRRGELSESEYERYRGTTLCGLPSGDYQLPTCVDSELPRCGACRIIMENGDPFERGPVRHRITDSADGPSLTDLVRLIEFLRANRVEHEIISMGSWTDGDDYDPGWMQVVWTHGKIRHGAVERQAPAEAFYVGPDGAVYDANGEAL